MIYEPNGVQLLCLARSLNRPTTRCALVHGTDPSFPTQRDLKPCSLGRGREWQDGMFSLTFSCYALWFLPGRSSRPAWCGSGYRLLGPLRRWLLRLQTRRYPEVCKGGESSYRRMRGGKRPRSVVTIICRVLISKSFIFGGRSRIKAE